MNNKQAHSHSVLEPIIKEFWTIKSLDDGKKLMKDLIESKDIREYDKKKMVMEIDKIGNLVKLQFYFTNLILRFEGLSISTYNTGSKG